MARILVPADFGLLAMATTFAATIDALSQFGLQEALIRRREDDQKLHDTAFTLQFGRAVVTAIVIALAAPWVSSWFSEPRLTPLLWVLAIASAVSGLRNIGVVAFRRDMNYHMQFVLLCVPRLIQVAATIPLALILQTYWALLIGIMISKLSELVMSYSFHPYRPNLSLTGWRELAAFSLWTWAASLGSIVWNRADPFLIGPAIGAGQLGVYLIASEIACLPITELVVPAAEALFGGFSLSQKQGGSPVGKALEVATTLLLVIMPAMIATSCASGYIVAALLGPAWVSAQPVVAVAAWLGLFSPYSFVCSTALVSSNHVRGNFVANCIASVMKLVGLTAVLFFTRDLTAIAAAGVLIVGLEATAFVVTLTRVKEARAYNMASGLIRIIASCLATLSLMWVTGLSWTPVVMPVRRALLLGGLTGGGAILAFMVSIFLLWRLAGRPDGPETRTTSLIKQIICTFRGMMTSRLRAYI